MSIWFEREMRRSDSRRVEERRGVTMILNLYTINVIKVASFFLQIFVSIDFCVVLWQNENGCDS